MSRNIGFGLVAFLLLNTAVQAQVTLTSDADEFESRAGSTAVADYERIRLGSFERIPNAGLILEPMTRPDDPYPVDTPRLDLINELVGLPANFWFGGDAKGSQFILTNAYELQLSFPVDQIAFGFDAACFGCDLPELPSAWAIELYDEEDRPVGQIEQIEPLSVNGSFVGVLSPQPFRRAVVTRLASGNWLIDNIRQSAFQPLLVTNDATEFETIAGTTAIANLEDQPLGDVPV
ncbi:MAG: hypothetical protein KDI51_18965, partial [Xanthomonadales bacterium]|nr:hypothetical protein [Xanthomonadales bacterium]